MTRLLFTGATVWAGATCTPRPAWLLVEDDRVAALGEHEQPPPADDVLDLVGCHVLPGFVDVHLHLSQAAWFPHGGDGMAWGSLAEARHAIRVAADAAPTGPWLLFWRVPRFAWPEGRLPTARELDEAAPGRRVLVSTLDMHRGALSSAGLAALGVADQRAGQFGDEVTRDRRGRPTGEVWEAAYGIALQRALADTAAQHGEQGAAAVLAAEADRCLAYGITHAHDPYVSPDLHQRMCALHATGPLREALRRKVILRPHHLHTPYLRYTDTELTELMAGYAAAGLRLRIHALGNLAVAQAARALRTAGVPAGTATIDHLLLLDPATADLVAASGATASYQPGFIPRYGDMISATRTDRHLTAFGARLLQQAGVPLALSSDYPCGALDPLHNLRAAIHRRRPSGRQLQPEQALTQSEAVRAHTVTAAASLGVPGAGGLAPGQPADLVICDGDPFQPQTRVTQTWVAGRPVWHAPDLTRGP